MDGSKGASCSLKTVNIFINVHMNVYTVLYIVIVVFFPFSKIKFI